MWREVCSPPSVEDLKKLACEAAAKGSAAAGAPIVTTGPPRAPEAPTASSTDAKAGDAKVAQAEGPAAARPARDDAMKTAGGASKPDALMKAAVDGEAKLDAKAEAARIAAERRAAVDRAAKLRAAATKAAAEKAAAEKAAAEKAAREALASKGVQWSYEGETGPANWGKLRPEWAICGEGTRQSPIDLREGIGVDLTPLQFDYRETRFRIIDTGQTLQVDVGPGMGAEIRGVRYELEHLRFHRPSLERVGGQASSMVVNLHHKAADGRVAIVGMMLESDGAEHPLIQTLWNNLPLERGSHYMPEVTIDLAAFVPQSPGHYLYMGSLPTPPCTEGVLWVVMKEPVKMSETQLGIFARLYPRNGRPIQPRNGRLILESR
jgi:carbonic anhydrase